MDSHDSANHCRPAPLSRGGDWLAYGESGNDRLAQAPVFLDGLNWAHV